jgi:GDP-4-dehydro-6-deoxy-D-mannose reductase
LKKILISGHSGFVGTNLLNFLDEYDLTGISNVNIKSSKIPQIKKDIRFITSEDVPRNLDCIIHLAAMTDVKLCQDNPKLCYEINVLGTQNLLEIARTQKIKFIFLSTSHVYGDSSKQKISESDPKNPTSIYSTSKLAGELLCESYSKSYGLDISIIRLFSVYGPNEPSYKVTSEMISQLLNKKIVRLGNLSPKRDFIYIQDAVLAIKIILEKSRGFNSYNIGSEKSHSIMDLYNILKKITSSSTPIKSIKSNSRKYDAKDIISNSSKIKKLGWKPKITLEEGMALTLQWYFNKLFF